jgi:hypothetical protein
VPAKQFNTHPVPIMKHVLHAAVLLVVLVSVSDPAQAQARSQPYTLSQIVSLLQGGWAGTDIIGMVREDCISFRVTGQNETALRRAGADAALLSGLRGVCFRGASPSSGNPTPPPARGIVLIEGELPPGWSRRVNDLPVSTNRRIDLTPGRTASIVVSAPGWCPARTEITLRAGEEQRWTPELRARPWIGGCV